MVHVIFSGSTLPLITRWIHRFLAKNNWLFFRITTEPRALKPKQHTIKNHALEKKRKQTSLKSSTQRYKHFLWAEKKTSHRPLLRRLWVYQIQSGKNSFPKSLSKNDVLQRAANPNQPTIHGQRA